MRFRGFLSLFAIVSLVPAVAFAKKRDQGGFQLTDPVRIGSSQLEPGAYKVEWTGRGPNLKVDFVRNNRIVATTTGELVTLQQRSPYDDVVLRQTKDGKAQTIEEIDFSNRTEALRIGPQLPGANPGTQHP